MYFFITAHTYVFGARIALKFGDETILCQISGKLKDIEKKIIYKSCLCSFLYRII